MLERSRAEIFKDALLEILPKLQGAFCFVFLYDKKIYAARDPHGFHPLQLGRRGNDHIVVSESCAIDHLSIEVKNEQKTASFVRDINPGELVVIGENGLESIEWAKARQLSIDIFEFIYFLRPDSKVYGVVIELARRKMGCYLAEDHPPPSKEQKFLVVPVNRSGSAAAWGYFLRAKELGFDVEYEPEGLFRPNDSGRVWVMPYEEIRLEYLGIKFNIIEELVSGRNLIAVDDSIVRGPTAKRVISLLRRAKPQSVHFRVTAPQYYWPDIYGNDTYKDYLRNNLIARRLNGDVSKIAEEIGADSLGYLSLKKTKQAILDVKDDTSPLNLHSFHDAVFTGFYRAGKGDFIIV
jgi:amidophosphoribosyltransferase